MLKYSHFVYKNYYNLFIIKRYTVGVKGKNPKDEKGRDLPHLTQERKVKMKIVNVEKIIVTENELNKIYDIMNFFDEVWENSDTEKTIRYTQIAAEALQDFIEVVEFEVIEE